MPGLPLSLQVLSSDNFGTKLLKGGEDVTPRRIGAGKGRLKCVELHSRTFQKGEFSKKKLILFRFKV